MPPAATHISTNNIYSYLNHVYYQKTMDIIRKYGIYSGPAHIRLPVPGSKMSKPLGLAYAHLVSFGDSKHKELLLLYIDNRERVTYEVWNDNRRLAIGGCYLGVGIINYDDLSLVRTSGKMYFHLSDGGSGAGGGGIADYFWTIAKGRWVTAAAIKKTYTWNSSGTHRTDTYTQIVRGQRKNLTKSEYTSILKRYTTGTTTDLFTGGFGDNYFDLRTSENDQVIRSFLRHLKGNL